MPCFGRRAVCFDFTYNPRRVSNCIHALTTFTESLPVRIGRTNFGEVAGYYITRSYEKWIICPHRTHCWIADLLGLGQYPIKWRTLDDGRPRPAIDDRRRSFKPHVLDGLAGVAQLDQRIDADFQVRHDIAFVHRHVAA